MSFYNERLRCRHCKEDVNYLQSTEASYCAQCGRRIQLFAADDLRRIRRLLGTDGPKSVAS